MKTASYHCIRRQRPWSGLCCVPSPLSCDRDDEKLKIPHVHPSQPQGGVSSALQTIAKKGLPNPKSILRRFVLTTPCTSSSVCRSFSSDDTQKKKPPREVPWRVCPPTISRDDGPSTSTSAVRPGSGPLHRQLNVNEDERIVDLDKTTTAPAPAPPAAQASSLTKEASVTACAESVSKKQAQIGVPPLLKIKVAPQDQDSLSVSSSSSMESVLSLSLLSADAPHQNQNSELHRHKTQDDGSDRLDLGSDVASSSSCSQAQDNDNVASSASSKRYDFSEHQLDHGFDFPPSWFANERSTEHNYGVGVGVGGVDLQQKNTARQPSHSTPSTKKRQKFLECSGEFVEVRQSLDYAFHHNYIPERQLFQDQIIGHKLDDPVITDLHGMTCARPENPWLVFTAGAYGAGKSYTIHTLVEKERFPLSAFVKVDPDEIRRMLPEFEVYVNQESTRDVAGELTRKEAGFICEILAAEALKEGKNVLVDGSLRDCEWYKQYFSMLRNDYPFLRIAILHITAPWEAVLERAAKRALETGRVVPLSTLERAFQEVPKSVNELAPLADYVCELQNGEDIKIMTKGETWHKFKSKWYQICAEWY
jgi:predicted kinase